MSSTKVSKISTKISQDISQICAAVTAFFENILTTTHEGEKRVKRSSFQKVLNKEETKQALHDLLAENLPKATKVKGERKRTLKHPDAPPRPQGPFFLFNKDHREQVKNNGFISVAEQGKELGRMWAELKGKAEELGKRPPGSKLAKAEKDIVAKYAKYVEAYDKAKEVYDNIIKNLRPMTAEELKLAPCNQEKEKKSRGRSASGSGSGNKKNGGVKGRRTAYMLWAIDTREHVKAQNPKRDEEDGKAYNTRLSECLSAAWHDISPILKAEYIKKEIQDSHRYEQELKSYTDKLSSGSADDSAIAVKPKSKPASSKPASSSKSAPTTPRSNKPEETDEEEDAGSGDEDAENEEDTDEKEQDSDAEPEEDVDNPSNESSDTKAETMELEDEPVPVLPKLAKKHGAKSSTTSTTTSTTTAPKVVESKSSTTSGSSGSTHTSAETKVETKIETKTAPKTSKKVAPAPPQPALPSKPVTRAAAATKTPVTLSAAAASAVSRPLPNFLDKVAPEAKSSNLKRKRTADDTDEAEEASTQPKKKKAVLAGAGAPSAPPSPKMSLEALEKAADDAEADADSNDDNDDEADESALSDTDM